MQAVQYSEEEIIQGLKTYGSSSHRLEDSLYLRYQYLIEEGRKKYSLNKEDAFSCYSDAVINVIENIRSENFEGRSSLKTYLYQIFHNKCVDQIRKNSTKKSAVHRTADISDMMAGISDTARNIIQRLSDQADLKQLQEKLSELGENCRKMLLMSAEGYTDREIARVMDYKTDSVAKTSRLRCLEKLRQLYKARP